jgi:hypothetical protein
MNNFEREHYWEREKVEHSLSKIVKDIQRAGFKIEKSYRIFENPYYRFFILRKE